jgi:hypothetical protein
VRDVPPQAHASVSAGTRLKELFIYLFMNFIQLTDSNTTRKCSVLNMLHVEFGSVNGP